MGTKRRYNIIVYKNGDCPGLIYYFCILIISNYLEIMEFSFKKPTQTEWLQKVEKDLKGKKSVEELHYQVDDFVFSSFITEYAALKPDPILRPSALSTVLCSQGNSEEKNRNALRALECGVQSVAWEISENDQTDVLFKDVFIDMIDVLCYVDNHQNSMLFSHTGSGKEKESESSFHVINRNDEHHYVRLHSTKTFSERVTHFKKIVQSRQSHQTFYVDIELKKEFLPQIAELRSLRRIWKEQIQKGELIIITHITKDSLKESDIHPLIVCNYLIMSGRMGMADYVMSLPFGEDDELARLSLNIHHILTEESRFGEVSDPTAGSYLIEEMTESFSRL